MTRLAPAFLSCLLLCAHFMRGGSVLAVLACLALPMLVLAVRRRWALRLMRWSLFLGCLLWLVTAFRLGLQRLEYGEPFVRMSVILGAVAAFTGFSAWLLSGPSVLGRYPE